MEPIWIRPCSKQVVEHPLVRFIVGIASLLDFAPSDEKQTVRAFEVRIDGIIYRATWRRSYRRALRDALHVIELAKALAVGTMVRDGHLHQSEASDSDVISDQAPSGHRSPPDAVERAHPHDRRKDRHAT